jgi:hypothetical protein
MSSCRCFTSPYLYSLTHPRHPDQAGLESYAIEDILHALPSPLGDGERVESASWGCDESARGDPAVPVGGSELGKANVGFVRVVLDGLLPREASSSDSPSWRAPGALTVILPGCAGASLRMWHRHNAACLLRCFPSPRTQNLNSPPSGVVPASHEDPCAVIATAVTTASAWPAVLAALRPHPIPQLLRPLAVTLPQP